MSEEILHGGNTSTVVRAGDTVRRQTGHWTPAVHALLEHLEQVGFDGAPRVLGLDEQGREILPFVDGVVGTLGPHRLADSFQTLEACRQAGRWLRSFHAAQQGYEPDPALPWRMVAGRALATGEVVLHHDAAPYNSIQRPDGGLTVIDWDFCAPGEPVEDLAFSLWSWVPLWHDRAAVRREFGEVPTATALHKFAALVDGYAADASQRARLPGAILETMEGHARGLEELAAQGEPAFVRLLDMGYAESARRNAGWFSERESLFAAAIT
jgi:Phosphotransferase enzyme family